jgi:hypothetical protein
MRVYGPAQTVFDYTVTTVTFLSLQDSQPAAVASSSIGSVILLTGGELKAI